MADISDIVSIERKVEIVHPKSGDRLGIRCGLVSLDDDRLKKVRQRILDRRLYLEARGDHFKAEELEENGVQITWATLTGWEWYNPTGKEGDKDYDAGAMPTFHGEVPEFLLINVKRMIKEKPWFSDQINKALSDDKSFFTA